MAQVGLIDYKAGNIKSIVNAFEHLGVHVVLVRAETDFENSSHFVLPGVGAFGFCAERLRSSGLLPGLEDAVFNMKRPLLAICVGMQLLADSSDELGSHQGLGWVGGSVELLRPHDESVRIPHVGWNTLLFEANFGEYRKGDSVDVYFDHSYAYRNPSKGKVLATCTHGETFCAAVNRDNIVGVQFHPEKSQDGGMRFLRSFLAL